MSALERLHFLDRHVLVRDVCILYGADVHDAFVVGVKTRACVRARDHVMTELRRTTPMSFNEIGRIFGLTHHSVMSAITRHESRIKSTRPTAERERGAA